MWATSTVTITAANDYNMGEYDILRIYCNIDPAYDYVDFGFGVKAYSTPSGSSVNTDYFYSSYRVYRTDSGYTYINTSLNNYTSTGKPFLKMGKGLQIFYWQLIKN